MNTIIECDGKNFCMEFVFLPSGYQLLFQMSMSDTASSTHAIVRVVCLVSGGSPDLPSPGTLELENIGAQNDHTYYYFVLYTTQGCKL